MKDNIKKCNEYQRKDRKILERLDKLDDNAKPYEKRISIQATPCGLYVFSQIDKYINYNTIFYQISQIKTHYYSNSYFL